MKLVALAVVAASRVAVAGHYAQETPDEKAEDAVIIAAEADSQWESAVGLRAGTFHVGDIYDSAFGFGLQGGVRHGRYALLGEYTFLGISAASSSQTYYAHAAFATGPLDPTSPPSGIVQRVGAIGRYDIFHGSAAMGGEGIFGGLYVEAGLGEQLIRWSGGGYLHRGDIELGVGTVVGGRGSEHHGGISLGFRATLTGSPAGSESQTVTCAGPCDGPTGPIGIDRSLLFTLDFMFGS